VKQCHYPIDLSIDQRRILVVLKKERAMAKLTDAERNLFNSIGINSFVEYSEEEVGELREMAEEISHIISAVSQRAKAA
jgi:hypothetical protein